jgi:hypothetical protein
VGTWNWKRCLVLGAIALAGGFIISPLTLLLPAILGFWLACIFLVVLIVGGLPYVHNLPSPLRLMREVGSVFTKRESQVLAGMVEQRIGEGFTTPPYTPEQYAIFQKLGIKSKDQVYDIERPKSPTKREASVGGSVERSRG